MFNNTDSTYKNITSFKYFTFFQPNQWFPDSVMWAILAVPSGRAISHFFDVFEDTSSTIRLYIPVLSTAGQKGEIHGVSLALLLSLCELKW